MSGYCSFASTAPLHQTYHDEEYGFPVVEEPALFERLILEINQAGLSWDLILRKRENLRRAYDDFDVDRVAAFDTERVESLLLDPGIIRHRKKIEAAIENARRIRALRETHGGFAAWLAAHHPLTAEQWVKLFRRSFVFTGPQVVGEFLMSIGYLPGAHHEDCPSHARALAHNPPWVEVGASFYRGS